MKLPESVPSKLYKELVSALKRDPHLGREIKTWQVGDGDRKAIDAMNESRSRPLLQLLPQKGPTRYFDSCSVESDMVITVELVINEFSYTSVMDLWSRIEAVVFDPTNQKRLNDLGVIRTVPSQGEIRIGADYSGFTSGTLTLTLIEAINE